MKRRGFSLLEVLVALAILSLAITALSGITANSFETSNYANHLTVATLLARSKMIDVEEELRKDGFGDDEKTFDGDFSDEGYPSFKWEAVCRPIEVDIGQLVGNLFGGDVDSDNLSDQVQDYIGAFTGGGDAELSDKVSGSDFASMLGGGHLEGIFKQIGETLGNSIREIELVITWPDGKTYVESVKFVQYVTTSGRLALPQGPVSLPNLPTAPGHRNANTLQPTIGGKPINTGVPTGAPSTTGQPKFPGGILGGGK